jgi:hypothetical protein
MNAASNTERDDPSEQLDEPAPESTAVCNLKIALRLMAEQRAESDAREARMASDIRALQASNWRLVAEMAAEAERNKPVPEWVALWRAVRRTDWPYQTILKWCVQGVIEARKPAGRWEVEMNSLWAKIATLRDASVPPPKRRLIRP